MGAMSTSIVSVALPPRVRPPDALMTGVRLIAALPDRERLPDATRSTSWLKLSVALPPRVRPPDAVSAVTAEVASAHRDAMAESVRFAASK
jgi:hypothetical protein